MYHVLEGGYHFIALTGSFKLLAKLAVTNLIGLLECDAIHIPNFATTFQTLLMDSLADGYVR